MVGIVALPLEDSEPRSRGTDLLQEALDIVRVIHDMLRSTQSRHKSYVDRSKPFRLLVEFQSLQHVSIRSFGLLS